MRTNYLDTTNQSGFNFCGHVIYETFDSPKYFVEVPVV